MNNYKKKYLKYKNKYLQLKGGSEFVDKLEVAKQKLKVAKQNALDAIITFNDTLRNMGIVANDSLYLTITDIYNNALEQLMNNQKALLEIPFEIIIPTIDIPSHFAYSDTDVTFNNTTVKKIEGGVKRTNVVDLTHFLFKMKKAHKFYVNTFYINFSGLYYHDINNPDNKNINIIKELLVNGLEENSLAVETKIMIQSEEFWNESKFFLISDLICTLKLNDNLLSIDLFDGQLMKKGYGHLMLCALLTILLSNEKFNNLNIDLQAGSHDVVDKFYKSIGFDCTNLDCTSNINRLFEKCAEKNYNNIKLILQDENHNFHDNLNNFFNLN
jgi:hypothetical protein